MMQRDSLKDSKKALALMQAVGFDEIPVQVSQAELGRVVDALKDSIREKE